MPFIGLFDSGRGGENALAVLRTLLPEADIVFHADTENAPYGTKSEKHLLRLIRADLDVLRGAGAVRVLIACCTASGVYPALSREDRDFAFPILHPTAKEAVAATRTGKIGVLATDATVDRAAFRTALAEVSPGLTVTEVRAQPLVALAQAGVTDARDPALSAALDAVCPPLRDAGIDTLILGCTHFPTLAGAIGARFPGVTLISSAAAGARAFAATLPPEWRRGTGKTVRI